MTLTIEKAVIVIGIWPLVENILDSFYGLKFLGLQGVIYIMLLAILSVHQNNHYRAVSIWLLIFLSACNLVWIGLYFKWQITDNHYRVSVLYTISVLIFITNPVLSILYISLNYYYFPIKSN